MADRWYEHSTIYSVDVRAYVDSNGDGCGDLPGLISRLDHLHALGITAIWLQPIYGTPLRDGGYDVSDHFAVDPRVGTISDFLHLVNEAEDRGMRIVLDLVVDHTSDEHRWFRAARASRDSPFRDYYVWADEPHDVGAQPIFPGHQDGVWSFDDEAGQYYLHRFYDFEPDLNLANEAVQDEVRDLLRFWTGLGASGFRIDAAPYIAQKASWGGADGHAFLRELHGFVRALRPDAVLMAETDVAPEEYATFFGGGEELDLLFDFYVNNHLFLALAREDTEPVEEALRRLPLPPSAARYVNWLRNHDELDLGRLSAEEREDVYARFAPEERMRLYGRGIRRRLAPMLEGDAMRIGNAFGLLFGLPGVPIVLYGEEIGMGDDLSLPERQSVRTPMQWDASANGGFSSAPAHRLVRPVVGEGPFAYPSVNVATARQDPRSLLNLVERLVRSRRESPEIQKGTWSVISTDVRQVFGIRYDWDERVLAVLVNIGPEPVPVDLDLGVAYLEEVVSNNLERHDPAAQQVQLPGYGFCWLRGPRGTASPSGSR